MIMISDIIEKSYDLLVGEHHVIITKTHDARGCPYNRQSLYKAHVVGRDITAAGPTCIVAAYKAAVKLNVIKEV